MNLSCLRYLEIGEVYWQYLGKYRWCFPKSCVFSDLLWKLTWTHTVHLETTSNGRPEWEDHRYTIPPEGVLTIPWEAFCTSMTSPRRSTTDHWLLLLGLRNIWCRSVWRWSLLFVPWKNGNSSELGGATPAKDPSFTNHRKIHVLWGCPSSRCMRVSEIGIDLELSPDIPSLTARTDICEKLKL